MGLTKSTDEFGCGGFPPVIKSQEGVLTYKIGGIGRNKVFPIMGGMSDDSVRMPVEDRIKSWMTDRLATESSVRNLARTPSSKSADAANSIAERSLLPAETLKIVDNERRRIGQDLHDVLGQELTGLAFLADSLAAAIRDRSSPEAELAAKIKVGVGRLLRYVKAQASGLIPSEIAADGLFIALKDLAARIREQFGIPCQFSGSETIVVENNITATHLYRIAQEAVTNALHHGHARRISLRLTQDREQISLCIRDNGSGFSKQRRERVGLGLRIMQSRAELIQATLRIEQAEEGGVRVTCRVHRKSR